MDRVKQMNRFVSERPNLLYFGTGLYLKINKYIGIYMKTGNLTHS